MGAATGPLYRVAFRRRRKNMTDYTRRLGMIKAETPRMVVRASNKNIYVQFMEFDAKGDKVLARADSTELEQYGWLSQANTPSAYLTGMLAAMRAKKAGVKGFHLDIGINTPSVGRIFFAAALGAKAAGINGEVSEELVDAKRLDGSHIAAYAKELKTSNSAKFNKEFSRYIKKNIDVTNLPQVFTSAKGKIIG